jgi:hypothetical protein
MEQPLDQRNYDRFGIQTWIDRGWNIEVWDLTALLHPLVWKNYFDLGSCVKEFDGYFALTSKKQLNSRFAASGEIAYFIDLGGHDLYSIRVKARLVRLGAKRIILNFGSMPEPVNQQSKFRKILSMSPAKLIRRLAEALFRRLFLPLIRPELGVASGTESLPSLRRASEIIYAHNLDYDIYLKIRNSIGLSGKGHVVFIDQDYCFHSDYIYEGKAHPVSPAKYFPAISKTLHIAADTLGVSMCIAAHPRSSYFKKQGNEYFKDVLIKHGATAELIRDCSLVVCHNSTALQLAVLFEKPVIFITTDELNASEVGASIAIFASELGKKVINIDRNLGNVDWIRETHVDIEKYAQYKSKYIKIDGSPERQYWDIVIDHLDKQPHI